MNDKIENILTKCDLECEDANYHALVGLASNIFKELKDLIPKEKHTKAATIIAQKISRTF